MKAAWDIRPLGDLCKTGAGGTPLKSVKEYYEGGDVPWLMSGEVSQGEVTEATRFITRKGLENSSARLFPPNTVLIAMYGATAGEVGILRFEASTNQAVCGILPSDNFLPEFLFYYFLHKKDGLVAQAVGNAQPNISQIKVRDTGVPVAPSPNSAASSPSSTKFSTASPRQKPAPKRTSRTPEPCSRATCNQFSRSGGVRGGWRSRLIKLRQSSMGLRSRAETFPRLVQRSASRSPT